MSVVTVEFFPTSGKAIVSDLRLDFLIEAQKKGASKMTTSSHDFKIDFAYQRRSVDDKYPYNQVREELIRLSNQHKVLDLTLSALDKSRSVEERIKIAKSLKDYEGKDAYIKFIQNYLFGRSLPQNIQFRTDVLGCMPKVFRRIVITASAKRQYVTPG